MSLNNIHIANKIFDFKYVFDTYFKALCYYANRIVNDEEVIKDLVQDVFIRVWKTKKEFASEQTLKTYLYMATRNICLDHLKKQQRIQFDELSNSIESDDWADIDNEIIKEDAYRFLESIIQTLPDKAREVLLLNMNGLTNIEIAEELNVSVNTVKTHKRSAYQKIRDLYGEAYFTLFFILLSRL